MAMSLVGSRPTINRGDLVRALGGESNGMSGLCFWLGMRFGKTRIGFKASNGQAYWADASDVEVIPPAPILAVQPELVQPEQALPATTTNALSDFLPKKSAKRPYPWVMKASDADLAWEPEHQPTYYVRDGRLVRDGENYSVVRPGHDFPLGGGSDHYKIDSHNVTNESILTFCKGLVRPNGRLIVGHGYRVIQGYWVELAALSGASHQNADGMHVRSKLVVVNDHTCAGSLRASIVTYVGEGADDAFVGDAVGSLVNSRALHVGSQAVRWQQEILGMIETAALVQGALTDLLNAAMARILTDEDRKFFLKHGIKVHATARTALDAIKRYNMGKGRKISWGVWSRRLGDEGIVALCELLGKEKYGKPIDQILGGHRFGGKPSV
jgi:hypothetical protein